MERKKREPGIEVGFRCWREYNWSLLSNIFTVHRVFKYLLFLWKVGEKRKLRKRISVDSNSFLKKYDRLFDGLNESLVTQGIGVLCPPQPPRSPSVTGGSKLKEIRVLYLQQGRLQLLDCTVCPTYLTSQHPECAAHSADKSRHIYTKASLQVGKLSAVARHSKICWYQSLVRKSSGLICKIINKGYKICFTISWVRRNGAFEAKLRCCHGKLSAFPMVTISSRAMLPMTSNVDTLPLATEPVARDNNTSWTLKPGHQTFVAPHSTDNRNNNTCGWFLSYLQWVVRLVHYSLFDVTDFLANCCEIRKITVIITIPFLFLNKNYWNKLVTKHIDQKFLLMIIYFQENMWREYRKKTVL